MFKFTQSLTFSIISLASVALSTGIVPIKIANNTNIQQANAGNRFKSWIEESIFEWGNNHPPEYLGDSGSNVRIIHTFPYNDNRPWEETKADCHSRGGDDIEWIGDRKTCTKTIRYNFK